MQNLTEYLGVTPGQTLVLFLPGKMDQKETCFTFNKKTFTKN